MSSTPRGVNQVSDQFSQYFDAKWNLIQSVSYSALFSNYLINSIRTSVTLGFGRDAFALPKQWNLSTTATLRRQESGR